MLSCGETANIAHALGFDRVYFTEPRAFPDWKERARFNERTAKVEADPFLLMEDVTCVALLVYAYSPHAAGYEYIPSYYLNSHIAFSRTKDFVRMLGESGVKTMHMNLPARAVALGANIGSVGKNALLRINGLGSRIVLTTVGINGIAPMTYNEVQTSCGSCKKCAQACPMGAIDDNGLTVQKCMRYHMEGADHPDFVNERIRMFLGCEVCMYSCPFNSQLKRIIPNQSIADAFDLDRLQSGDTREARELVGRNKTGNGKLQKEAAFIKVNLNKANKQQ